MTNFFSDDYHTKREMQYALRTRSGPAGLEFLPWKKPVAAAGPSFN
jgi:hypothetical protein